MSKRRLELAKSLSEIRAKKAKIAEDVKSEINKKISVEQAPLILEEQNVETMLSSEKDYYVWIVRAKSTWDSASTKQLLSAYDTKEEAMANCPPNSHSYYYDVIDVYRDRTMEENVVKGGEKPYDPPSR